MENIILHYVEMYMAPNNIKACGRADGNGDMTFTCLVNILVAPMDLSMYLFSDSVIRGCCAGLSATSTIHTMNHTTPNIPNIKKESIHHS